MGNAGWEEVTGVDELDNIIGEPTPMAADKVRTSLHEIDRTWLAASRFCLVATADSNGSCDVSPKGDPPGVIHVLDERTVVIADRKGNRRVDGFRNVLTNPHVGLISLLPGRGDTLRINGRATLVRNAPFFDELAIRGVRPRLALVVAIDEVFYHCAKAFLRSKLWNPSTWDSTAAPARAQIAKTLEARDVPLEALQSYYGESYADPVNLYGA